jgi:outer membrane lipopolysaccharide assembly protein LptE/RlpB
MNAPVKLTILLLLSLAAEFVAGCGYTTDSQYRGDVKTVAVPIWTRSRDVYYKDIEIRLTEALAKRVEAETPYKVADKRVADTELTGTLKSVKQRVLSFDPNSGFAREIQIRLIVDFTWKDLRSGEILLQRENYSITAEYILLQPFNEEFFQGTEDDINKLAERVVQLMAKPF